MRSNPYPLLIVVLGVLLACVSVTDPYPVPVQTPLSPTSTLVEPPASPTPSAPTLTRLTEPGCCVQPYWSADSQMVLFVDKPGDVGQSGIYGVSASGGAEQLYSEQVGLPSADGKFLAFVDEKNQTVIRQLSGAVDHVIDARGQRPAISPGDRRVAWAFGTQIDTTIGTRVELFMADIDGSNPRALITVYNGGVGGWLDDDHLLVAGRKSAEPGNIMLFSLEVTSGALIDIASETRIRNISVAPGGGWVSYAVTFDTNQPPDNGLWVASADGQKKAKLPVVGGAQWRDDHRLLIIPLEMGVTSHRLWQFDAASGQGGDLTDPAITPFRVTGGEWSVSPDGRMMVFLNAADHALWVMGLPG